MWSTLRETVRGSQLPVPAAAASASLYANLLYMWCHIGHRFTITLLGLHGRICIFQPLKRTLKPQQLAEARSNEISPAQMSEKNTVGLHSTLSRNLENFAVNCCRTKSHQMLASVTLGHICVSDCLYVAYITLYVFFMTLALERFSVAGMILKCH